jgi:serine/threonine protein kinase
VNFTRGGDVKLSEFDLKVLIGQGSFAKVFLVQHVGTERVYAMKILKKKVLIELESVEMIK